MKPDLTDSEHRTGLLTGRALAISEVAAFVKRLTLAVPDTDNTELRLRAHEENAVELARWLGHAALESVEELVVLQLEAGAPPT